MPQFLDPADINWDTPVTRHPESRPHRFLRPLTDAADRLIAWAQTPEARIYFGVSQLDELTRGTAPKELAMIIGHQHNGKCVTLDTVFTMADGRRLPASLLKAGDFVRGINGEVEMVEAVEDNGVRPIVRMETHCGLILTVTEEHPVLLADGRWVPAKDIRKNDQLVGEADWLSDTQGGMTAEEARFLGHLIGDGSLNHHFGFTASDPDVLASVTNFVARFGGSVNHRNNYDYSIATGATAGKCPLRAFLVDRGVALTTSSYKRVPTSVMTGGRDAALGFLAGLLDTDGSAMQGQLTWYSVSRELLEDCQALLARIGFRAKLTVKNGRYRGQVHRSWRLNVPLKEGAAELHYALPLASSKRNADIQHRATNNGPRANPPLSVKTVELLPEPQSTLAVQVSGSHTHLTNGIVTHNTLFVLHGLVANRDKRVVLFTPDEPAELVLAKLASVYYGLDAKELEHRIQHGDDDAIRVLRETATDAFPNLVVFDGEAEPSRMQASLDEAQDMWGAAADLVVFDYLELISGVETVSAAATLLKGFGKANSVPLWVLHQTSRSAGRDGQQLTIDSGAYGGGPQSTFIVGVRRKKYELLAQLKDLRAKRVRTERDDELIAEIEYDLRIHQYTISLSLLKNKRPGGGTLEQGVDFELERATGRLVPLEPGELPVQYYENMHHTQTIAAPRHERRRESAWNQTLEAF